MSFEEAAAFPLVFETAYRMLVTKAGLREGEWVLVWGIGGGLASAANVIARALGARTIVTSSSDEKLATGRGRRQGQPRIARTSSRRSRRQPAGAARTSSSSTSARRRGSARSRPQRQGGRITVCGATSGPNPPAALHRIWWKQLTIFGSTMGTKEDFEGAYELVTSGRAKPVVDEVFPLAEARAAHERMEAGDQLGKIVLTIPG